VPRPQRKIRRAFSQTRALRVLKEVAEALNSATTEQQATGEALRRITDLLRSWRGSRRCSIIPGSSRCASPRRRRTCGPGSRATAGRFSADDDTLARASAALEAGGYLTHEFGDSMLVERTRPACADAPACYWLSNSPSTLPSVSAMRAYAPIPGIGVFGVTTLPPAA